MIVYRVNWDNGASACGTFPETFATEEDAQAFANAWMNEMNDNEDDDERWYVAEVISVEEPDADDLDNDEGAHHFAMRRHAGDK
jgi:hypothetical protein